MDRKSLSKLLGVLTLNKIYPFHLAGSTLRYPIKDRSFEIIKWIEYISVLENYIVLDDLYFSE